MDKKTYYKAKWKVLITKHIMKLGERYGKKNIMKPGEGMENKTYYEARWKVWITKLIMKPGERYG